MRMKTEGAPNRVFCACGGVPSTLLHARTLMKQSSMLWSQAAMDLAREL